MINTINFFKFLKKKKINFFCGVPDSILKSFSNYLDSKKKIVSHHIVANEGGAIALAAGYNLATKKIPVVYMQNSGLGNAINPLVSICHKKVYSIPMILLIGWRGSPNSNDEPQHKVKGNITKNLLNLVNIKHEIINHDKDFSKISKLISYSKKNSTPVALLVKNNVFFPITNKKKIKNKSLKRVSVLKELLKNINNKDRLISTTGFTSRELYQLRMENNRQLDKGKDFYMVGGMGHTSMLALGVSLNKKDNIYCIDGDGSLLMHLGSIVTIGKFAKKNFRYILLNNNSHESVGGQTTNSEIINFKGFASSLNFKNYYNAKNIVKLKKIFPKFVKSSGPNFLEVNIGQGTIKNLIRPKSLIEIKSKFVND